MFAITRSDGVDKERSVWLTEEVVAPFTKLLKIHRWEVDPPIYHPRVFEYRCPEATAAEIAAALVENRVQQGMLMLPMNVIIPISPSALY